MIKRQLDIENLPEILNFYEEEFPSLKVTHARIVEAAKKRDVKQAEAVSNTYRELAETNIKNRLESIGDELPGEIKESFYSKAICGVLIKLADIWQEAGVKSNCIRALDRAISYAKNMRWESIATALETEKEKLQALPS